MAHEQVSESFDIQLCYALPASTPCLMTLRINAKTKIADVPSYLDEKQRQIVLAMLEAGSAWAVFGKKKSSNHQLKDGDRIELCRPLIADPMSARRHRAKREHKSGKM